MTQMIVISVNTTPPVTFISDAEAEVSLQLADWAREEWSKIFDLPCPTDLDVVVKRVLRHHNVEAHKKYVTVH